MGGKWRIREGTGKALFAGVMVVQVPLWKKFYQQQKAAALNAPPPDEKKEDLQGFFSYLQKQRKRRC